MKRITALAAAAVASAAAAAPSAPAPSLAYAFSADVKVAPPVELGAIDGGRRRFIAITGGTVDGPRLKGEVLASGGDWQTIMPGGLTRLEAKYFIRAADGTVIEVTNIGVRTAAPEVIDKLARGEPVDPSLYYFRTSPSFKVAAGSHQWLERTLFVARGIRRPDRVIVDFYEVR
jgi:Protein of unknown function (DUF3237)